jgi:exonuclease SbcC
MIPLRLTLKNFLSYREATLDFQGLHVACVCGANGSGKSSLLEAIAWALWGQSRANSEDDAIHQGAKEAQVDFLFENRSQVYRVIRTRTRGQATSLEFQVATTTGFRSLTERGVRATQQLILQHIRLDYDTFINSAYLRQGRADEFMLKRPSERKQILTDLLKLEQYDQLAEQAKDRSRELKGKIELIEQNLEAIATQLQQRQEIAHKQESLKAQLSQLRQSQEVAHQQLQAYQASQTQRQTWLQQLTWQQHQHQNLSQDCQHLQQELALAQQQQRELMAVLQQEATIAQGYTHWQQLQIQEEIFSKKFHAHQQTQQHQHALQQQLNQQIDALKDQLRQVQAQLETGLQQHQDINLVLSKAPEIETALAHLQQARLHLQRLDQQQTKFAPLQQRFTAVQSQLDLAQARLLARLEELQITTQQLQAQQTRQPNLEQQLQEATAEIERLDKRRVYQQRVREKGLERKSFLEQLKTRQQDYEAKLAELEQKLQLKLSDTSVCPLCDRPLDQHHWQLVQQKQQAQHQEQRDHLWVVREQLAVSEREIQVLRQEYQDLSQELGQYGAVLERRGHLQAQLQAMQDSDRQLALVIAETAALQRSLSTGDYATELHGELQDLEQSLQALNYDEKDHALARGEVERWRWAEIKQAELKQAQRRQTVLQTQLPQLQTQVKDLQQQLQHIQGQGQFSDRPAPLQQQILALAQTLIEIDYNLEEHNTMRLSLRQAQSWQLRYQELQQAQQQYPHVQQRLEALQHSLQIRNQDLHASERQIATLQQQLAQTPDLTSEIQALETQSQQRRQHLDEQLAHLGRLQQLINQLDTLQVQSQEQHQHLQVLRRQYRVYQELAQAFGKNGIQSLMIENVLPQLEVETNQILSRLSANQLHVQFVTQRASRRDQNRSAKAKLDAIKLIDTLDILIADTSGTRPYETYSGGEAFRVNFAIRLALARLLAQRSGTPLQMLIVDEGFGTQDQEGCDRLVAAINAIAPDFTCILAVTHMPQLKEAFQIRIEVCKTPNGSQLSLVV